MSLKPSRKETPRKRVTFAEDEVGGIISVADNTHLVFNNRNERYRRLGRTMRLMGAGAILGFCAASITPVSGWVSNRVQQMSELVQPSDIATMTATVEPGGTTESAVCSASQEIAKNNGINPKYVSDCVGASQEAASELYNKTGSVIVYPGQEFTVKIAKNGLVENIFNTYTVDAAPVNK